MANTLSNPDQIKNGYAVDELGRLPILLEIFTSHHKMAPLDLFNRLKSFYSKDERESVLHWLTDFGPETPHPSAKLLSYPPLGPAVQKIGEQLWLILRIPIAIKPAISPWTAAILSVCLQPHRSGGSRLAYHDQHSIS